MAASKTWTDREVALLITAQSTVDIITVAKEPNALVEATRSVIDGFRAAKHAHAIAAYGATRRRTACRNALKRAAREVNQQARPLLFKAMRQAWERLNHQEIDGPDDDIATAALEARGRASRTAARRARQARHQRRSA
jgi:hypothetical protein